jgi:hypothetical protein
MRRALRPDGLFLACLFAGDTLTELRQSWLEAEARLTGGASPRVAPMIDVRELGSLLQRAGFALPVADLDRTIVRYADAVALIHEIRSLGLSNVLVGRSRRTVTKATGQSPPPINAASPMPMAASAPPSKCGHRLGTA